MLVTTCLGHMICELLHRAFEGFFWNFATRTLSSQSVVLNEL